MKTITADIESFYDLKNDISVSTMGLDNYVRTQDAYMVSLVSDDFEFVGTIEQARQQFGDSFWACPDHHFAAANSNFDEAFCEKYFPPNPNEWHCILDQGVGNQLPRDVANLSRVVLGKPVDKSLREFMNGVRFETLPDDKQQEIANYCLNDSVEERKLMLAIPPLSPIEQEIAALTRRQNRRGVYVDVDRVDKDVTVLHTIRHSAFRHIPWRADCSEEKGLLSARRLAKWCEAQNIPVPESLDKRDQDCTELMSDHPALKEVIEWMRRFRTAGTLIKKAETLRQRLTPDNRLPLDLLYCGAPHTRRWSSQGWNIQNLAKEPFFGEVILDADGKPDLEKSESVYLRNWLVPAPGKIFLILDYSQIEPRCLNWLAGNDAMLAMIRAGYGIYEAHSMTFKGWRGAPGTLKKTDPRQYAASKAEVLGLGFGMGGTKFKDTSGLGLSDEEALSVVRNFRSGNPKIPALWDYLDNLMKQAVLSKDKHLKIEMPTGDFMHHFHVRQTAKIMDDGRMRASYMSSKTRGVFDERGIVRNLWGGTLTENVTQRMARDVMAEAMVRAEKAGLTVKWSTHDELILEVDQGSEKFLSDTKAEAERILTEVPAWAEGLPLAVEGDYCERYTK